VRAPRVRRRWARGVRELAGRRLLAVEPVGILLGVVVGARGLRMVVEEEQQRRLAVRRRVVAVGLLLSCPRRRR
jgi:hypothetical protein